MSTRAAFDISAALDGRKIGAFGVRLIILSWLVTFFDGFDMNVVSFMAKRLTAVFHLTPTMLSLVFSSGVLGTVFGGFLFGWLGDRIGRRPSIIAAVGAFSVLTLALAFARSYEALLALRFLDGLALGGVLPLIWALNTEFAPKGSRATVVTLIMLGYGIGVAVAGPIARLVLPRFDWPGVFVVGAALSLLATIGLIAWLPESLRFLAARGDKPHAIAALLRRMGVSVPAMASPDEPARFMLTDEDAPRGQRFRFSMLFDDGLKWLTPLLWLAYFASSISTFFITFWAPSILQDLGFSADHAAYVSSMNSLFSALGGVSLMRFTDRHGPVSISVLPLASVPLLMVAGLAPINLTGFLLVGIPVSILLGGSHYGITSIVAAFYPSRIRANGAGWCSGVAKIGSVLGPLIGGFILTKGVLPYERLCYALLAACPLVYGLAILTVGLIVRRQGGGPGRQTDAIPAAAE